jgi:hypothetical protein
LPFTMPAARYFTGERLQERSGFHMGSEPARAGVVKAGLRWREEYSRAHGYACGGRDFRPSACILGTTLKHEPADLASKHFQRPGEVKCK